MRRVLIRYARQGCDFEHDHQIRGASIGYIPDGWEQRDAVPGPEELVIPRLVPWAQQFETAPVRYVASRLNEQEVVLRIAPTDLPACTAMLGTALVHSTSPLRVPSSAFVAFGRSVIG